MRGALTSKVSKCHIHLINKEMKKILFDFTMLAHSPVMPIRVPHKLVNIERESEAHSTQAKRVSKV